MFKLPEKIEVDGKSVRPGLVLNPWRRFRRWWLRRSAQAHVISFPKCGRTWLLAMISKSLELHSGIVLKNPLKLRDYHKRDRRIPLIYAHHDGGPEFRRVEALETSKAVYRDSRVILLTRDPRDVLVSSYFQKTKRNVTYKGELADYVREPAGSLDTNIAFYNIWMEQRGVPRGFLLVTYEDMRVQPGNVLRQCLDFLGFSDIPDAIVDEAVEFCSFENMKRRERSTDGGTKSLSARNRGDAETFKMRKGKVGGYSDYLSAEELAYVNARIDALLTPELKRYHTPPIAND